MTIRQLKYTDEDYSALYEKLEERYGPFVAQDLVDQIRRVEEPGWRPDYMTAKALSEVLDAFRLEAANAVRHLKGLRHAPSLRPEGLACLEEERASRNLKRVLPLYWIVMQSYYRYVAAALAFYQAKPFGPARHSEIARAA